MRKGHRYWIPALIILMAVSVVVFVNMKVGDDDFSYQKRNMVTILVSLFTPILLLGWWMLLSRFAWGARFKGLGLVVVGVAMFLILVKVEGVTGDFAPIFKYRFSQPVDEVLAEKDNDDQAQGGQQFEVKALEGFVKDYPAFLGDGRYPEIEGMKLDTNWEANKPELVWKQPIGKGWSAFAIADGRAVTMEQRGEEELVTCYEASSGELIWSYGVKHRYNSGIAGDGPRSTPTIKDSRVYALYSSGRLMCLDLKNGTVYWDVECGAPVLNDMRGPDNKVPGRPEWGNSCSPLVVEGVSGIDGVEGDASLVVVDSFPAPTLRAFDTKTGELVWDESNARMSYASPVLAEIHGERQLVRLAHEVLEGRRLSDGKLLWSIAWEGKFPKVAVPVVLEGGRVFVTSGYGVGSQLFQVSKADDGTFSVQPVWKKKSIRMKGKFVNVIAHEGYVYGMDDGVLACIDLKDGQRMWKRERVGHGQLIKVGEHLLVTGDEGVVYLVKLNPKEYELVGTFEALEGKTWNPPALAGQYLFWRSDVQAGCFQLKIVE